MRKPACQRPKGNFALMSSHKVCSFHLPLTGSSCGFNEAAARRRRIQAEQALNEARGQASMRPPPAGGGYCRRSRGSAIMHPPSMRPPLVGGGYHNCECHRQFEHRASMRPPLLGGGYVQQSCCRLVCVSRFNEAAALGRRIRFARRIQGSTAHASMRPPLLGGGYNGSRFPGKRRGWLQ